MPSVCVITFKENPAGVYYGGQTLSGTVCLTTDRLKTIRGIYIVIKGHSQVRWTETTGTGKNRRSTTYFGNEEYFNSRVDVMGSPNGENFDLQPGAYEYHFQIALPQELPSSFNSCWGKTKYDVSCVVDRPWKFDNVFKRPFTVIHPLDLNLYQIYLRPVERENVKKFSKYLCCGNGGDMFVKATVACGGYVPGQSIPVSVYIKNLSNISTYETNACLIQTIEYRSQRPYSKSKYEHRSATVNYFGPLEKQQEKTLNCTLLIPAIAPSSLVSSSIIEISYYVEIQLKTRGLHRSMNVRLPVTVGTVPYGYNPFAMQPAEGSSSEATPDRGGLPTYEEAVNLGPNFVNASDDDKFSEQDDYAPRYPVYSNLNTIQMPSFDQSAVVTTQPSMETKKQKLFKIEVEVIK